MAAELVRRRVSKKQPAPPAYQARERPHVPAGLRALADESWSELTALSEGAKRKHVHWTHVRTHNPRHQQPESFTKKGFWEFLCKVYKDVYPEAANATGSILLFGMVAKERHAAAQQELLRDEHHHAPVYTSRQHYWRPVAQKALEVYNVKLHAACHDGYASMYIYLRKESHRKPMAELDAVPFFSPEHPQGDVLRRLLDTGAHAERDNRGKRREGDAEDGSAKRFRPADLYGFTERTGVRTYAALLERASAAASQGDTSLAEFCTVHSEQARYIVELSK